ncbi:glycosyltransferase [Mesorhizobium sp. VK9D]|uniref:glycosyltransferase n=1 Tax=Mesorhizobium australafricanum TaxID=3072311 RepID=UPI002A24B72D|nr:glycosyltransferase [Mesorhizobium sp. VK9D]MDX8456001.1 glycosyltransferase [Mesorhizobium sp. VK9D]
MTFEEPHHHSLELLAAQALARGEAEAAFKFADRRCRVRPHPEPRSYVLRGQALFRLGDKSAAIRDLRNALDLAPEDIAANRRMLAWADGAGKIEAAAALIPQDRDLDTLRVAMEVLHAAGRRHFGSLTVLDDTIEGWAVWTGHEPLELTVTDGSSSVAGRIQPDPLHAFSDLGRAAGFRLPRPNSPSSQLITLSVEGEEFHSRRVPGNAVSVSHQGAPYGNGSVLAAQVDVPEVTVVVPVFKGYDATRACLDSLMPAVRPPRHRVLLVDNATPEVRISNYLDELSTRTSVTLIKLTRNLGFVGAVNRALSLIPVGDVVLLNSDTIVPSGFIDRLAEAARSSRDIGTVTPLSNNGEYTSFPIPNTANPVGSLGDVTIIDGIAARTNAGHVVDLPSGIGFCLYVTRACLDAVGLLSENFDQGYLEDADFCLRARERGFRSVCAPGVFVGHAGSISFGREKRSLVVRNLGVLKRRFPEYTKQSAAFVRADPLRRMRESIERAVPASAVRPRLLVTGSGAVGAVTGERARLLGRAKVPSVILEVRHEAHSTTARLLNAAGGLPQSIRFQLSLSSEHEALREYVNTMRLSGIEILDPAKVPLCLIELIAALGVPYDIFIADAGLLGRHNESLSAAAIRSGRQDQLASVIRSNDESVDVGEHSRVQRWREFSEAAGRILVPCDHARAFASSFFAEHRLTAIGTGDGGRNSPRNPTKQAVSRLGLVPVRSCAEEQFLMCSLARVLREKRPELSITVIGSTLDDHGLMRFGNVFVTGSVEAAELDWVSRSYGLQSLFLCATRPIFGHPLATLALNSALPVTFFDWSLGRLKSRKGDLPIDPGSDLSDITSSLCEWMES